MTTLERNIKELIQFYVKENYNDYLQKNSLQYIEDDKIESVVSQIYTERKEHLKTFVKESLKELMKDNPPSDLIVNNILIDVFRDDDFCINRIVIEIKLFQQKKREGKINTSQILQ
tara:strand:+ start:842 stop:1189 length:348 start_codon:yes stop_codon:yes gene_type:complete